MAKLSEEQRREFWAELMRYWSRRCVQVGVLKQELRAAVDAVDDWLDAAGDLSISPLPAMQARRVFDRQDAPQIGERIGENITTINRAIPAEARAGLRIEEKQQLAEALLAWRLNGGE